MRSSKPIIGITYPTKSSSVEIIKHIHSTGTEIKYFAPGIKYIDEGKADPAKLAKDFFDCYDGLVIPGNDNNINPDFYNKKNNTIPDTAENRRIKLEIALVKEGIKRGLPILGICSGHQVINIALGGTLCSIKSNFKSSHVTFYQGTHLNSIMYPAINKKVKSTQFSSHQQAIEDYHPIIVVSSHDGEGVIKSIEVTGHPWLFGTQFHPEMNEYLARIIPDVSGANLFHDFVESVAAIKIQKQNKKLMHQELLNLTSLEELSDSPQMTSLRSKGF